LKWNVCLHYSGYYWKIQPGVLSIHLLVTIQLHPGKNIMRPSEGSFLQTGCKTRIAFGMFIFPKYALVVCLFCGFLACGHTTRLNI